MKFSIDRIHLIIFLLGLVYILAPGPTKIEDFSPIPNSLKSDEPGDTYQNPNIAAYFSDFDRNAITNFYRDGYKNKFIWGIIPPISLNYPPETSKQYIRDQQSSTFLEEYIYPLRGSIFVNGYEPFVENEMHKNPHNFIADHLHIQNRYFASKTTIRFYPADGFDRLIVYMGIWFSVFGLTEVYKNATKKV